MKVKRGPIDCDTVNHLLCYLVNTFRGDGRYTLVEWNLWPRMSQSFSIVRTEASEICLSTKYMIPCRHCFFVPCFELVEPFFHLDGRRDLQEKLHINAHAITFCFYISWQHGPLLYSITHCTVSISGIRMCCMLNLIWKCVTFCPQNTALLMWQESHEQMAETQLHLFPFIFDTSFKIHSSKNPKVSRGGWWSEVNITQRSVFGFWTEALVFSRCVTSFLWLDRWRRGGRAGLCWQMGVTLKSQHPAPPRVLMEFYNLPFIITTQS